MTNTTQLSRTDVVFDWSIEHEPLVAVSSGDEIYCDMWDASGGQLGPDATIHEFEDLDHDTTMPISGPVYVEGAKSGDTLEIEILEITTGSYGWTGQRPDQGVLTGEEFPDLWVHVWKLENGRARFSDAISVPVEPFPGMIGVTPREPGRHTSDPPRRVGGNLDTRQLWAGTTLYLPVEVDGAFFGIGDGHAAQGDGEVCGSAVEVPMAATVRLTVRKDLRLDQPEYLVPRRIERPSAAKAGYFVTTGVESDLYAAVQTAVRGMVRYLSDRRGLDPQDAYGLCSVAADLKISEVVDRPNWLVSLFLPLDIFES